MLEGCRRGRSLNHRMLVTGSPATTPSTPRLTRRRRPMARAPKCKICGRRLWGLCDHGLRGDVTPNIEVARPARLDATARRGTASVTAPSIAQVQAEKEALFTALVTKPEL